MDAHLRFKEHHNRCMMEARAAEARLQTLTMTYGVVPESIWDVQIALVQAFTLYGSKLWWDPKAVGRRDNLQLLLNRQAWSVLGVLPTTPRGALMRESGLTPAPVILDSRQQRFAVTLANTCIKKLKDLHQDPSSRTPICSVVEIELEHGRTTEFMSWLALREETVVETLILDNKTTAKSAAQRWAREKQGKVGA